MAEFRGRSARPAVRPVAYARAEDLEALTDAFLARLAVVERAMQSMIEDLDAVIGVVDMMTESDAPEDQEEVEPEGERPGVGYPELFDEPEESPAEEAARLRREAMEQAERENESEPLPQDINDITDVPEDGVTLQRGMIRDFETEPDERRDD
jgi:hypothetical protein